VLGNRDERHVNRAGGDESNLKPNESSVKYRKCGPIFSTNCYGDQFGLRLLDSFMPLRYYVTDWILSQNFNN